MYDKKFWDDIYNKGFLPWTDKHKDSYFANDIIESARLKQSAKILDYGCGEGILGKYFLSHGLDVDFAEISDVQVKNLKAELGDKSQVYAVNEPKDIDQQYDVIICSGVIHHIEPEKWGDFLKQFNGLLKKDGVLWISGFDNDDKVMEQYHGNAPATGHKCWPVNQLEAIIDKDDFELVSNYAEDIKIDAFETPRRFRFFCLKTKKGADRTNEKAPNLKFNKPADRVEYVTEKLQKVRDRRQNAAQKDKDPLSEKQRKMKNALLANGYKAEDMGKTGENWPTTEKDKQIAAIQSAFIKGDATKDM